ncbi:MAG: YiiX/YebB-like N1pC/P60 family cysteine hydrolase [Bdellovibrionales bacterium]
MIMNLLGIMRRGAGKVIAFVIVALAGVGLLSWWYRHQQFRAVEVLVREQSPARDCGGGDADFKCEVLAFQKLAEEALVWRVQAQSFLSEVRARRKDAQPLTSRELDLLHQGVRDYLDLRQRIMALAYTHRKVGEHLFELAPGRADQGRGVWAEGSWSDRRRLVDPTTPDGRLFSLHAKLALAAALTLYDNFLLGIQPYQTDHFLRRLINSDNSKVNRAIDKVTLSYQSRANAQMVGRALKFHEQVRRWEAENPETINFASDYLDHLIAVSPSLARLKRLTGDDLHFATRSLSWFIVALSDRVEQIQSDLVGTLSGAFGNTLGLVETRKGLLFDSKNVLKNVERTLRPLDILLEKTPFRLTDALIPGHWGHVAVWVGGRAELEALGLWDHETVRPWHKHIESGRQVIEALRSGVEVNSLEHFLNVDDLLVLRPQSLSGDDQRAFLVKAFQQLGKAYDFNFDVETDKRIVCSELIYVTFFKHFTWPTQRTMGRATISPDHVARAALEHPQLTPVLLYHQGKEVQPDVLRYTLQRLLEGEYATLEELARLDSAIVRSPSSQ